MSFSDCQKPLLTFGATLNLISKPMMCWPDSTTTSSSAPANPKNVEEFKAGNTKALNGLVGPIMKASKGKANPAQVNELLLKKLG